MHATPAQKLLTLQDLAPLEHSRVAPGLIVTDSTLKTGLCHSLAMARGLEVERGAHDESLRPTFGLVTASP